MMNETMRTLVQGYERLAYTNRYIYGFIYKGVVYATKVKTLTSIGLKISKASRGNGYALRFRPTVADKEMLLEDAIPVCSEAKFIAMVENSKYNKGEIFEKLITELYGKAWKKNNVPFNKGADIVQNGISYQIKFQNATFCNERQLARI